MLFRLNKHEKIVISVRMEKDLLDRIDKAAADADISRNEVICQTIQFALDHTEASGSAEE